jgi:tRNA-2-methylthio-N6-dimethylallyladenosine synthase
VPDLSLSTDIIVGYPGESDADFEETLTLLAEVQYDSIYSFAYSERPDTPALKLKLRDDVPASVKDARLHKVQALQREITALRLDRLVGRTAEVLVEGASRNGDHMLCGRLPGNEMVNFAAPPELIGRLVPVEVTHAGTHTLTGRYTGETRRRLPMLGVQR